MTDKPSTGPVGFEPTTDRLEGGCSIPLSYGPFNLTIIGESGLLVKQPLNGVGDV